VHTSICNGHIRFLQHWNIVGAVTDRNNTAKSEPSHSLHRVSLIEDAVKSNSPLIQRGLRKKTWATELFNDLLSPDVKITCDDETVVAMGANELDNCLVKGYISNDCMHTSHRNLAKNC